MYFHRANLHIRVHLLHNGIMPIDVIGTDFKVPLESQDWYQNSLSCCSH